MRILKSAHETCCKAKHVRDVFCLFVLVLIAKFLRRFVFVFCSVGQYNFPRTEMKINGIWETKASHQMKKQIQTYKLINKLSNFRACWNISPKIFCCQSSKIPFALTQCSCIFPTLPRLEQSFKFTNDRFIYFRLSVSISVMWRGFVSNQLMEWETCDLISMLSFYLQLIAFEGVQKSEVKSQMSNSVLTVFLNIFMTFLSFHVCVFLLLMIACFETCE